MDFSLTEPEKMLQKMAGDFAAKEVAPLAAEIDRTNEFPRGLAKELGRRGFQGLPFPAEYGGSGAGYVGFVLALEQICKASVSAGAIMAVNTVPEEGIYRFGNEEQKKRLLAPLARGEWLGGIGFTETETGSDPRLITAPPAAAATALLSTGKRCSCPWRRRSMWCCFSPGGKGRG
jgi:alkylation response protein AidB-like acyl-CoA dehydrogenase